MGKERGKRSRRDQWDAGSVRALRRHLGVSQDLLADELGTRQQTVSEWETGRYRPRGASARMLSVIAERAGFEYDPAGGRESGGTESGGTETGGQETGGREIEQREIEERETGERETGKRETGGAETGSLENGDGQTAGGDPAGGGAL